MNRHEKELHAMKMCALVMENLTGAERRRVLAWLEDATEERFPSIRYSGMTENAE